MNIRNLVSACEICFDLSDLKLSEAYYYNSLPLCIIDAVFSIGVNYTSTANVVKSFCKSQGLDRIKNPESYDRYTVDDLITLLERHSYYEQADVLYNNHQRTSSKNGILKAEAVYLFASALKRARINTISDFRAQGISSDLERAILSIPGQKSGLSLHYFCMLAGDDSFCKPDRHVLRFISHYTETPINVRQAQEIMSSAVETLKAKYPNITVRSLDFAIWKHMSTHQPLPDAIGAIQYNKLVRDRIPEIISADGKTCTTEILSDADYLRMLDAKLDEELAEYHKDQNIEELADLLEVLRAAAVARGYTLDELERVRAEKASKRGGFEKKILLKEVIE